MKINIWNPLVNGLSVSALELWLVNKVAFELSYFHNLMPVEVWNKNMCYGSLMGAGIEGWIKHRERRLASRYIEVEMQKQIQQFGEYEEIMWWTQLAEQECLSFINRYEVDLNKYAIIHAERKHKIRIELPSGREITLKGYTDGESEDGSVLFEHKARAEWNVEAIADEIDLNLQIGFYCLLLWAKNGRLPDTILYHHSRRPGGFRYRGPKIKKEESKAAYLERCIEYMMDNTDDHFHQFVARPTEDRFYRFLYVCLYPILESFVDWFIERTHPDRDNQINRTHWMTPYGLYNPYLEGTAERFRQFAITGTTIGLVPKRTGPFK